MVISLLSAVKTLRSSSYEDAPACRYRRRRRRSSLSSAVMRSAPESHARPSLARGCSSVQSGVCVCVCRQISTCVRLKSKDFVVGSPSWRNGGPSPPVTVIYSSRTSAAFPSSLTPWAVWVMTGCFCEKNFPFYLIKCGAWPTPRSMVCLAAFHSSYLRRKLQLG